MIDFYIKQNISVCELEAILGDILNFEVKFLAIADDDFTPHNNNYNFDEYPVICSYIPCVGDVALFISIFDGDKLDSERLILNIEKVAKKWQLDFFLSDESVMDPFAFIRYSSADKNRTKYQVHVDEENPYVIQFIEDKLK